MTTWLARVALDTRNRTVRDDLADAVALHKRVMRLVPDGLGDTARNQAGLLFRIEETRTPISLLIQSQYEPDLTRIPPGYGVAQLKNLDPLLDALRVGVRVRYRIAASPVKRVWAEKSRRGKIEPLEGKQADEWWIRRAADAGLHLLSLTSRPRDAATGGTAGIRHAVTQFDGTAVITDAERVAEAVRTGIGKGKSYGCGLLSLAPAAS